MLVVGGKLRERGGFSQGPDAGIAAYGTDITSDDSVHIAGDAPPPVYVPNHKYEELSNQQLVQVVLPYASTIRTMEKNSRAAESAASDQNRLLRIAATKRGDMAEKRRLWEEDSTRSEASADALKNAFNEKYRAEGQELRMELGRRLHHGGIALPPTPSGMKLIALDYGILGGIQPLTDAANYLEQLCHLLPKT